MPFRLGPIVLLATLSAAFAETQSARGPKTPIIEEGVCPFEGCVFGEWTVNRPIDVRSKRSDTAPIAFQLNRGDKVQVLTGVLVTTKVGRIQFREPFKLGTFVTVKPGETLLLVRYEGEGFATVWFKGETYPHVDSVLFLNAVCEDRPERCSGKVVEQPESEWWVQVRASSGAVGWTRETVRFNGKSALGMGL